MRGIFCCRETHWEFTIFPPHNRESRLTLPHEKHARPRSSLTGAQDSFAYGPALLPVPHPSWRNTAWLKKNPWFAEEVLPWLRSQVAQLAG